MKNDVKISVLIPAYNERNFIREVIESVRKSFAAVEEFHYEIIVCDNNSSDDTGSIAREAGVRVVFEEHNQIARARNSAARAARGEWLIFVDADSMVTPELVRRTLEFLQSGTVCGGGALVRMDREDIPFFVRLGLSSWNLFSGTFLLAAGSYIFCLREAWTDTGGFDERYYAGEEIGFSRRLKQWSRRRGKRFVIIRDAPVTTSARKVDLFTPAQMFRQFLICLMPTSLRRRNRCGFWYRR